MLREVRLQTADAIYVYREEDKIGEGGFGCVYYGKETSSKYPVAVKRPHFYSDEALERFKNKDCRYLPQLEHDHIVKVLAILTEIKNQEGIIGPPALIMEYIPGQNLQRAWEKQIRPLSFENKLILFRKICEAILYAHRQGIIHRDIKPGNILLTSGCEPKIIDFGLAASLNPEEFLRITRTDQVMGSLLYMSPEQQNARKADKKSDIYSLGLILFFIFTNKHAREMLLKGEHTLHQVFDQHLPREIAPLCKQACHLNRQRRTKSVKNIIRDIDLLLTEIAKGHSYISPSSTNSWPVYLAYTSGGVLVGIAIEQLFYTTRYWGWLWFLLIAAFPLLLLGKYWRWQIDLRLSYSIAVAVGIGMASSSLPQGSLWYYFVVAVSTLTILFWSYLLYDTIS